MSKLEQEARLLTALSKELGVLATLERFELRSMSPVANATPEIVLATNCKVSFETPYADNGADEEIAMAEHISQLVAEGISELVEMAVDRQRKVVEECRKAIADFHRGDGEVQDAVGTTGPAPGQPGSPFPPPPSQDQIDVIGRAEDEVDRKLVDEVKDGVDLFEDDLETV